MAAPTLGGWMVHVMRRADGALTLEESLHIIMDSTKEYFPCQSVAVLLIDDDTKELRIKISRQISYTFVKQFHRDEPSRTAEKIVLEQTPMLLNDLPHDSDFYEDIKLEHDFTSAVLAPVIKNQRGIGYVHCDRKEAEPFTESDMLHLQVIGYLIGQLMEKFDLLRQRKSLSQIDDASQALQYKAFVPALGTELERGRKHDYSVSLALLSVDTFRKYIETYGINEAHALLEEVVGIIKENISDVDILARFGADEFVLCLSGTGEEDAIHKLETIKNTVYDQVVGQGDSNFHLTVGSITLTTPKAMRLALQDILGALGKKLVEAKNSGPGSVVTGVFDG